MNSVRPIHSLGLLLCWLLSTAGLMVWLPGCRPPTATDYIIAQLRPAVNAFKVDCGRLPTTSEGLAALLSNPGLATWRGPYLASATVPTDQWRTGFRYEAGTNYVIIRSAGPDKIFGTRDDITKEWTW